MFTSCLGAQKEDDRKEILAGRAVTVKSGRRRRATPEVPSLEESFSRKFEERAKKKGSVVINFHLCVCTRF